MISLPSKESLTVEFKSDPKGGLKDSIVVEAVVGLTNAEGGKLYIGISDDGEVTGVHSRNWADVIRTAAFIASHTVPPVTVRAELLQGGLPHPVMVIEVPKASGVTATIDGKILKRRLKIDGQPENYPFFPYEFTTRLTDLGRLDFTERVLPDAVYEDLDPEERLRFRQIIRDRKGDATLLELEDEDFDKALHLAVEEHDILRPTVAGLLMIGRKDRIRRLLPTVGAVFQIFDGTSLRLNRDINLPILASLEEMKSVFDAWNFERELSDGLFRVGIPEFSEDAFREALLNAFTHRDYSCLGRISVRLIQEGLEITSPGGFISGISLDNLLTAEPRGRNPVLADCLKRSGLTERSGRGIDRIFEGSLRFGRPLPDYSESNESYVRVMIPRAEPDLRFIRFLRTYVPKNVPGQNALSVGALLILNALNKSAAVGLQELAETISLPLSRVQTLVQDLVRSRMIDENCDGKFSLLNLCESPSEGRTGKDPRSTVLDLVRTKGFVTTSDIAVKLSLPSQSAYRLLVGMTQDGLLKKEGSRRWSKYLLP